MLHIRALEGFCNDSAQYSLQKIANLQQISAKAEKEIQLELSNTEQLESINYLKWARY